jgi:hypothetical protein
MKDKRLPENAPQFSPSGRRRRRRRRRRGDLHISGELVLGPKWARVLEAADWENRLLWKLKT